MARSMKQQIVVGQGLRRPITDNMYWFLPRPNRPYGVWKSVLSFSLCVRLLRNMGTFNGDLAFPQKLSKLEVLNDKKAVA